MLEDTDVEAAAEFQARLDKALERYNGDVRFKIYYDETYEMQCVADMYTGTRMCGFESEKQALEWAVSQNLKSPEEIEAMMAHINANCEEMK